MSMQILHPPGWLPAIGYANGISVPAGRIVLSPGRSAGRQPEIPERGTGAAVRAGAQEHYRYSRRGWRQAAAYLPDDCVLHRQAGLSRRPARARAHLEIADCNNFPAMSMIFVADLLDTPAKIELEATAVIPE